MSPPAGATAIVEHHINAWDCLAGILLVAEAGGYVSDFLARRWLTKGNALIACAPGVKDALIAAAAFEGVAHMTEITLTHGDARATIALLGAEARSWRIAGRDLLWPGDPAIWSDISPILYPVVGWTRDGEERVEGVRYPLGLHGFARFETFAVETSTPDFARLTLGDNARHARGLSFRLCACDRIPARRPTRSKSPSKSPIPGAGRAPYACGLHPGFRWPLGAAGREGALVRSKGASGPRFRNSRRAALSARPRRPIPLQRPRSAALRRAVRP